MLAFVSGQAGKAAFVGSKTIEVVDVAMPSKIFVHPLHSLEYIFSGVSDLTLVTKLSRDAIISKLDLDWRCDRALLLMLIFLDKDEVVENREDACNFLDKLLRSASVFDFVKDRLFARPMTESADFRGALNCAEASNVVGHLVDELVGSQNSIRQCKAAWDRISLGLFQHELDKEQVEVDAIRVGVFRRLATAVTTRDEVALKDAMVEAKLALQHAPNFDEVMDTWLDLLLNRTEELAYADQSDAARYRKSDALEDSEIRKSEVLQTPGPFPSWDHFRFFLAISSAGSFSKAARELGVAQNVISRRIKDLELHLGVRLFDRLPHGIALTIEGQSILDAARHIENTVLEIQRNVHSSDKRMEGTVSISVSDELATYWLTPQLGRLQEHHPDIPIEFHCSIEPTDALKLETDLSIRSGKPRAQDLIAMKLGTMHFVPWVSPDYIARNGAPTTPDQLLRHRLLDHSIYYKDEGDWNDWFALARAANLISYMTNSSASMLSAIQNGLGIGMLPTFVNQFVRGIVPLNLDLRTNSEIWLTYHPDIQQTARVRAVIDWIKSLFDQKTYPWFRDEFYAPMDTTESDLFATSSSDQKFSA